MADVDAALEAGLAPVKLDMVAFERSAGYVPEMAGRVAASVGLQLELIEYMPKLAGRLEWAVDIGRVHEWLAEWTNRIEHREMYDRRRYQVGSDDDTATATGMVETVDPVENPTFCINCHRVRVTREGYLKGCPNRDDDLRSMGEMTKPEIREALRETVANQVPFYGECMIENNGEWHFNG